VADNKIKVSTPDDTMMQDPTTGEVIEAYGESEVTRTAWVDQQIFNGKLVSDVKVKEEDLSSVGSEPNRNELQETRATADKGQARGLRARQPGVNAVKT
jgi:hypothetical protein